MTFRRFALPQEYRGRHAVPGAGALFYKSSDPSVTFRTSKSRAGSKWPSDTASRSLGLGGAHKDHGRQGRGHRDEERRPPRRYAAMISGDGKRCQSRPELRPLYPPHWRELAATSASSALREGANVAADRTSSSSAACRTGAGSTSKRRHGGIAEDGPPAGPTLRRQLGFGRRASCSRRRTWTAIRPTIG